VCDLCPGSSRRSNSDLVRLVTDPFTTREARVSPQGWVAQLWPVAHPDGQRWLLTEPVDGGRINIRFLHDHDVADWPALVRID
jgi:hypothetical protein